MDAPKFDPKTTPLAIPLDASESVAGTLREELEAKRKLADENKLTRLKLKSALAEMETLRVANGHLSQVINVLHALIVPAKDTTKENANG